MTDRPPIPSHLWDRILAFLRAGSTGQIVLDVHRGRVQSLSLSERVRDPASDEPLPPRQPDRY